MSPTASQLLIAGASVRAAAQSARRAGQSVWGADLFGDQDLQDFAETTLITRYPASFLKAFAGSPHAPWIYTGALENYPRLVQRLAAMRPLLGNGPDVLRAVRDPFELGKVLQQAGIAYPDTHLDLPHDAEPDKWLLKPLRSAAGHGITFLSPADKQVKSPTHKKRQMIAQRFIPGLPCSAVYVAAGGDALLLGLTRQLIGWPAGGFTYCGSLGPVPLSAEERSKLLHIGRTLADRFSLTGLFGVDLVESQPHTHKRGQPHKRGHSTILKKVECPLFFVNATPEYVVIEVNPRYTASVELLERARLFHAIHWHLAACTQGVLPNQSQIEATATVGWHGKAILFARKAASFHTEVDDYVQLENRKCILPRIADIPAVGTHIEVGQPVVTLFADGPTEPAARKALLAAMQEFEFVLYQTEA